MMLKKAEKVYKQSTLERFNYRVYNYYERVSEMELFFFIKNVFSEGSVVMKQKVQRIEVKIELVL